MVLKPKAGHKKNKRKPKLPAPLVSRRKARVLRNRVVTLPDSPKARSRFAEDIDCPNWMLSIPCPKEDDGGVYVAHVAKGSVWKIPLPIQVKHECGMVAVIQRNPQYRRREPPENEEGGEEGFQVTYDSDGIAWKMPLPIQMVSVIQPNPQHRGSCLQSVGKPPENERDTRKGFQVAYDSDGTAWKMPLPIQFKTEPGTTTLALQNPRTPHESEGTVWKMPLPLEAKVEPETAWEETLRLEVIQPNPQFRGLVRHTEMDELSNVGEPPETDSWRVGTPRPAEDSVNDLRIRLVKKRPNAENNVPEKNKSDSAEKQVHINNFFIGKASEIESDLKEQANKQEDSAQGMTLRPRKAKLSCVKVQGNEEIEPPAPTTVKKVVWVEEGDGRPASRWLREE